MSTCCCCFVLYLSGLTGSAYRACGKAASSPSAMALLQVLTWRFYMNCVLRWTSRFVRQRSLGRAMSTLVVQERHLWLCLTDMELNDPVSQTGLFGDAVESISQLFSAAQSQTEVIRHIMRRRKPVAQVQKALRRAT